MKSILDDIYFGERGHCETIKISEKYKQIKKEYAKIYDTLENGLNDEQKQLLDELFLQSGGLESELACTHFKEGFKLGMLIALEILSE